MIDQFFLPILILMNTLFVQSLLENEHLRLSHVSCRKRKSRFKGVCPVQFPAMSTIVNFTGNDVEVRLSTGFPDFSNHLFVLK